MAITWQAGYASQVWVWTGLIGSYTVSGNVTFTVVSNTTGGFDLRMDIVNTAAALPPSTADILTGIYFDVTAPGQGAIGMKSATASGGVIDTAHPTVPASDTIGDNICAPGVGRNALDNTWASTVSGG